MLTRVLVVALLALFAPLAASARSQQARIDVTGLYHSNYDDVRLVQKGDRVTGTDVCCGGGIIGGRITEGRTLHYRWTQPGSHGLGVWTIGTRRLDGTWGTGQHASNGGSWDLERVASRDQIAN